MKTMLGTCCFASLPSPQVTDPSPPLWGRNPVMGLPDFPVPDAGFVVELWLLSLFLLSVPVPVLGSQCLKRMVYAPSIQMTVQGDRTAKPIAILPKIYSDSHILRDEGCFAQRCFKRRIATLDTCSSERGSYLFNLAFVLSVYVLIVFLSCRCRMTYFN